MPDFLVHVDQIAPCPFWLMIVSIAITVLPVCRTSGYQDAETAINRALQPHGGGGGGHL
jgi:hypothetical protein